MLEECWNNRKCWKSGGSAESGIKVLKKSGPGKLLKFTIKLLEVGRVPKKCWISVGKVLKTAGSEEKCVKSTEIELEKCRKWGKSAEKVPEVGKVLKSAKKVLEMRWKWGKVLRSAEKVLEK